ncbi:hypothetical protein PT2222_100124 [Paraburkholderia tropica]
MAGGARTPLCAAGPVVTALRKSQLLRGGVDGLLRLRHDFVDLAARDDERRREQHAVAGGAHDEVAVEAEVAADRAHVAAVREALARLRVFGELQTGHQTRARNVADDRMIREGLAQLLLEVRTRIGLHALDDLLVAQQLQVRDGHGGGHRMTRVREAVIEVAVLDQRLGHAVVKAHRAHRHITAREALGHRDEVRLETEVLMREPFARAAETADHFVGAQQNVVLAADALDFRPVGRRREDHAARALERLADEGGHVLRAHFENLRFELPGAREAEFLGRHVALGFAVEIRLIDMNDVLDLRRHLLVHIAHAAERAARDGRTVIRVAARDHDLLRRLALREPVLMHDAQHGVVAFRAAVAIEEVVERFRRDFGEQRREFDHRRMRGLEERVVERQLQHLLVGGVREFLAAIAYVHAPQTGHAVDDLVAVRVPQIHALGLHDHAAAGLVQRAHVRKRMDVMRGVQRAIFSGRACALRGLCAQRRRRFLERAGGGVDSIAHCNVSFLVTRAAAGACVPTN